MTNEEAIKLLVNATFSDEWQGNEDLTTAYQMAIKALEQTSKKGHWIEKQGVMGDTYYDCSKCGESFGLMDGTPTDYMYNYCPVCGADMRG